MSTHENANPAPTTNFDNIDILEVVNLLVLGADEPVVRVFKKWAGEHGRSPEAEHRASLTAALLSPPRRKLADLLAYAGCRA